MTKRRRHLQWQEIQFDRDLDVRTVGRLILGLVGDSSLGPTILEAESQDGLVSYRIGSLRPANVRRIATATVPGAVVEQTNRVLPATGSAWEVRLNTRSRPIITTDNEGASQRLLGALTHSLGAFAVHQVVIGPRLRPFTAPSPKDAAPSESWAEMLAQVVLGRRVDPAEARRALASKRAEAGAQVTIRVLTTEPHVQATARNYLAALRSLESPGLRLRLHLVMWRAAKEARLGWRRLTLNASELAALSAWPHGSALYPGLDRSGARQLPAASGSTQRIVGASTYPGTKRAVGLSARDALHHMHVLGPTGVGKSTLLLNLALQDIEANRGVVVIDPKGDLVDDILARVSDDDAKRVVVIDPASRDQLVGFNPLSARPHEHELAVDGVLSVFKGLNQDSWGPRTQDILHASLLTLVGSDLNSICYLPQLLTDESLRRRLLSTSNHSAVVRSFWSWFENLSVAERANAIAPVMNKLRPFTMRSALRGVLGQRTPAFDPMTVFTERKVLLVPLRKGQIGQEAANLLGALLLARLWQLTANRSSIDPKRRHPVFFYLDEFQDYLRLPADLGDVLAQARGLGVGLVLAHQHLAQLDGSTKAAVLANARSRIDFQLSPEDANIIARSVDMLNAQDFVSLKAFHAYARLMHQGQVLPTTSIATYRGQGAIRRPSSLAKDIAHRWGYPPSVVDTELLEQPHQPDIPHGEIGKRKRGAA